MPKKLLVADKSVVIQKSVGITFAQEDYTVTYVSDGEDALTKTRQIKPDLLLIHINTPKLSGYEVCEALKKDAQTATLPVVFFVGTHEALDEARFKACKGDGYVIKPFESQGLIDRVNELVNRRPLAAPTPSPAATIAGQVAQPPPAPRPPIPTPQPSPAATIAGQMPPQQMAPASAEKPTVVTPRDAPLLDLDVKMPESMTAAEAANAFDVSFDETITPDPVEISSSPELSPAESAAAVVHPEAGEFWDFSEPAPEATSPEAPVPPATEDTHISLSIEEPLSAPDFSAPLLEEPSSYEVETPTEPKQKYDSPSPMVAELSNSQVEAIVEKVFSKVIERIAWEVVPDMAERIIKEELARLTQEKS